MSVFSYLYNNLYFANNTRKGPTKLESLRHCFFSGTQLKASATKQLYGITLLYNGHRYGSLNFVGYGMWHFNFYCEEKYLKMLDMCKNEK